MSRAKYGYHDEASERTKAEGPASVNLRRAALLLGTPTIFLIAFVVGAPYWKSSAIWGSITTITNIWEFQGIFLQCVKTGAGQGTIQCYQIYTTIGNSGGQQSGYDALIYPYLNAFRALMIIALLASVAGVICSALGMRCATIIEEDSKSKRWTIMIGGVCHIVAGSLTGICVSWYAAEVVREFNYPYNQQQLSYTFGACLYLGWVVMVLSLICGILMTCCTCFNKPVGKTTAYEYSYKPPVAQEKYSYPPPAVETYKQDPIYKDRSGYRKSDYRQSKHSNHHSHHSSHYSGHRDHRASSFTSSHSHRSSLHRDSPKSSHTRHDSDIARASGFV
ncbi:claudin-1-like isoform X1 [Clavelina lepadiformis]|uniref:claudin-1-like isoform X1 n=1 Tax=Clavelina lepadiformis TaxID=159417 RepID=UPI0040426936